MTCWQLMTVVVVKGCGCEKNRNACASADENMKHDFSLPSCQQNSCSLQFKACARDMMLRYHLSSASLNFPFIVTYFLGIKICGPDEKGSSSFYCLPFFSVPASLALVISVVKVSISCSLYTARDSSSRT